ncbi:MAG: glycosyl hydrolase family 28 protein [Ignavibacteriales bacterium]|nr:glycosyl hydrolase family 28 protein [Ignavibacteriales bacterium]
MKAHKYSIWLLLIPTIVLTMAIRTGVSYGQTTVVVTYPGPTGISAATDRIVTVNENPVFVYNTAVNFNRTYSTNPVLETTPVAYFDFCGEVTINVIVPGVKIGMVTIRPLALGIKPIINGDTISFLLSNPAKLTIEINNNLHRALHLFANKLNLNPPLEGDPGVIYFGPGVHNAGSIQVGNDKTVYIAGGAVVYGWIKAMNMQNVKIVGRGILDGSIYSRWPNAVVPIDFEHCQNVTVDGILILDPAGWTLNTYFCDRVTINDVKIISARSNGDGITTQSCTNVTATDCFVRGWDDNLVVKGYGGTVPGYAYGNVKNVIFDNMILWTDLAQSCEIGYETRADTMQNITFKNITVLHNFHKPVMSIHNSDEAVVTDVHYDNVTVEDAEMGQGDGSKLLIDLFIGTSVWSQSSERGKIRNVTFNNIRVLGGNFPPSRIQGFDQSHDIENVSINNLYLFGTLISNASTGGFSINQYVQNVSFGTDTGIETNSSDESGPRNFLLAQNYPNPFNPSTTILYEIPEATRVTLQIYNELGQRIAILVDGIFRAGQYGVVWNGRDTLGMQVPSGIYFYRLQVGSLFATRKMLLLK